MEKHSDEMIWACMYTSPNTHGEKSQKVILLLSLMEFTYIFYVGNWQGPS